MNDTKTIDAKYVMQNYNRFPIEFVKGDKEFLFDDKGNQYIDLLAGIAVNCLGHNHTALIQVATEQMHTLQHASNLFFNRPQAELAQSIVEKTYPGKVFFSNSGTEANEAALKFARAYGLSLSESKYKVITFNQSFHGRTFGGMSLTGQDKIQKGFGPLVPGITHIDVNNKEQLNEAMNDDVCAVFIEPIQGEGGINSFDSDFVKILRSLTQKHKALLVSDEIQAGIGRTGHIFGYEKYNICPDIITMAKGLGGGFPVGATLVTEEVASVIKLGMHGSTFGGNFLACKVAKYVWDTVTSDEFLSQVRKKGELYREELTKLQKVTPKVLSIKGEGLMIGVQLDETINAREHAISLLKRGLVIGVAGGNTLRIVPPLTISDESIKKSVDILSQSLES